MAETDVDIKIDTSEVQKNLEAYVKKFGERKITKMLKIASEPLKNKCKANALSKVKGGKYTKKIMQKISKNIKIYLTWSGKRKSKGYNVIRTMINPDISDFTYINKETGKQTYIPTAIEYGHIARDGKTKVPAMPFMRPAVRSERNNVINKFNNLLIQELETATKSEQ